MGLPEESEKLRPTKHPTMSYFKHVQIKQTGNNWAARSSKNQTNHLATFNFGWPGTWSEQV
jgi:hypothetical protein